MNGISYVSKSINRRQFQFGICVLLGILLFLLIAGKIDEIYTVWELGDEAGYIFNAAYFCGADWSSSAGANAYYGFGYSVFLIPVWYLAETGLEVIRGALIVNVLALVGTYILLLYLLNKLVKGVNVVFLAIISFIVCLNPYLVCNALKVDCETIVTFWYCLVLFLFYKSIEQNKCIYNVLLGLALAYFYAIHTRTIVLIVSVLVCYVISYIIKKANISLKNYITIIIAFGIGIMVVQWIKNDILSYMQWCSGNEEVVNVIGTNYIVERLSWLLNFENLKIYLMSFLCKLFYLSIMTAGVWILGCVEFFYEAKNDKLEILATKLVIIFGCFFMILVCTMNHYIETVDFRYFFYSRYYENACIPFMAIMLYYAAKIVSNKKIIFMSNIVIINLGLVVLKLRDILPNQTVYLDTARIPAFSFLIEANNEYVSMIICGILFCVLFVLLISVLPNNRARKYIVAAMIFVFLWRNSEIGVDKILQVNRNNQEDVHMVECMVDEEMEVYMIDDDSYIYSNYWYRIQVLLKDKQLQVIDSKDLLKVDEISEGSYLVLYNCSPLNVEYKEKYHHIADGAIFNLYQKNKQ